MCIPIFTFLQMQWYYHKISKCLIISTVRVVGGEDDKVNVIESIISQSCKLNIKFLCDTGPRTHKTKRLIYYSNDISHLLSYKLHILNQWGHSCLHNICILSYSQPSHARKPRYSFAFYIIPPHGNGYGSLLFIHHKEQYHDLVRIMQPQVQNG